jgi:hypothetical protein
MFQLCFNLNRIHDSVGKALRTCSRNQGRVTASSHALVSASRQFNTMLDRVWLGLKFSFNIVQHDNIIQHCWTNKVRWFWTRLKEASVNALTTGNWWIWDFLSNIPFRPNEVQKKSSKFTLLFESWTRDLPHAVSLNATCEFVNEIVREWESCSKHS